MNDSDAFDFGGRIASAVERARARRKPVKRPPPTRPALAHRGASSSPSSSDSHRFSISSSSQFDAAAPGAARGAAAEARSSSLFSSASSSSGASQEPLTVPAPAEAPPPPAAPAVPAALAHARRPVVRQLRGVCESESWGGCLFTKVWHQSRREEWVGWQVTCRHKGHISCRRSANFFKHGGIELTERKLKMWLLLGAAPEVDSKECHFDFESPHDPHCLEDLEEMMEFFGLEA